jgi:hypothetical protein
MNIEDRMGKNGSCVTTLIQLNQVMQYKFYVAHKKIKVGTGQNLSRKYQFS